MKYNKLATVFCSAALGLMALTSCEGGDLYSVGAPSWISAKADSIANAKSEDSGEVIEGLQEDVYDIGKADYSAGFFTLGKTSVSITTPLRTQSGILWAKRLTEVW